MRAADHGRQSLLRALRIGDVAVAHGAVWVATGGAAVASFDPENFEA